MMTTPLDALPCAELHLGDARSVGVVEHGDRRADRVAEQLGGVGADPRLVDIRGRVRDAVLDHRGERRTGGLLPVEERRHLADDFGDGLGRGRVRGDDPMPVGNELAGFGVDRGSLDAGAPDVDPEQFRHDRHSRSLDECNRAMGPATLEVPRRSHMEQFDVVVIGGGAAGENIAGRCIECGSSIAVIESDLVGGECSYWACIPSKVLLRPGEVLAEVRRVPGASAAVTGELDVDAVLERRNEIVGNWDDEGQVKWLDGAGRDA